MEEFRVEMTCDYDEKQGITGIRDVRINGHDAAKAKALKSSAATYIDTTNITIVLTKKIDDPTDPCVWLFHPIIGWFVFCW